MGFRELRLEKGLGPGGSGLAPFNFQGAGCRGCILQGLWPSFRAKASSAYVLMLQGPRDSLSWI